LSRKKATIFVFSGNSRRVIQFRIPRRLPGVIIVAAALSVCSLGWVLWDYQGLRRQMPRLELLEKETALRKSRFLTLSQQVQQIGKQLQDLEAFDHHLRAVVNPNGDGSGSQFLGMGGSEPEAAEPYRAGNLKELVRGMHRSLDGIRFEISGRTKEKAWFHDFLRNRRDVLASLCSSWPTKGWLSSSFGYRVSPFTGEREFHKGIDIATRKNSPIIIASEGIVASVDWEGGYGRVVTIDHGYGLVTRYAHLNKSLVRSGQSVRQGEKIGLVGSTGRSTGNHLHYEVILNGLPVNPLLHYEQE